MKRFLTYAIPAVLIIVALQYTILNVLSVRAKIKFVNEQADAKLLSVDSHQGDSAYMELYKEKLWLENRAQIAKTDEISLSVNLKDSLLQLELKGVVIKTSNIIYFEADQFFTQLKPGAYYHLFATQSKVDTCFSTIAKQPFVIKKAPKDTSAVETATPAPAKPEAVHWRMELDNNVVFKIEGTDQYDGTGWWVGKKFWFTHDLKEVRRNLTQTVRFKVPEYCPEVRIVISEADAKAIYRALPQHHLVCVRM
jgi:hypothetical protein